MSVDTMIDLKHNCSSSLVATLNYDVITNTTSPLTTQHALLADELISGLRPGIESLNNYGYVLWYIIGLPANTLAFTVWIQTQMLNSSGCYMSALAMTDNIFLLVHCLLSFSQWFNIKSLVNYPVTCQLLPILYTAAQYMSGLLVLEFTVEQFIAIRFPFKRSQYCRVSIARKVIIGVALFVLALSSPQGYFFVLISDGSGGQICTLRDSLLNGNLQSFWTVWTWVTEALLFITVPFTCLILNVLVIYQISKRSKITLNRHVSRVQRNGAVKSKKMSQTGTTTIMLLVVSLYWVCTELPPTITLGIKQLYDIPVVHTLSEASTDLLVIKYLNYKSVRVCIEFICFSRYSCKLFLYLATGRQFRKHLTYTIFRCNKKLQERFVEKSPALARTHECAKLIYHNQKCTKHNKRREITTNVSQTEESIFNNEMVNRDVMLNHNDEENDNIMSVSKTTDKLLEIKEQT